MTLTEYLRGEKGLQAKLAKEIGVPASNVSMWASGSRRVPVKYCPAIERATNGAVRCEELRPDVDWSCLRGTPLAQEEFA